VRLSGRVNTSASRHGITEGRLPSATRRDLAATTSPELLQRRLPPGSTPDRPLAQCDLNGQHTGATFTVHTLASNRQTTRSVS
jgi:hypothetical protein